MDIPEILRALMGSGTQKDLADKLGVSQPFLCQVINRKREPGKDLLDAIGAERVVTYRQKAKVNG